MHVWTVCLPVPEHLFHLGLSVLDLDSQKRIRQFHFRNDACRCLLGRLLPRLLLKHLHGVPPSEVVLGRTDTGKPFIEQPRGLRDHIGFNVSHDGEFVAMTFQVFDGSVSSIVSPFEKSLHEAPEVSKIGIDIMKAEIPLSETGEHDLDAFIESLSDALTPLELYQLGLPQTRTSQTPHRAGPVSALTRLLDASSTACSGMSVSNQGSRHSKNDVNVRANEPEEECGDNKQSSITSISPSELERVRDRDENVYRDRLVHFFLLWTLKESYTKALGLGLGFDFKRIEYDSERDLFRVDKRAVNRWEIGVGVLNVSEADTEDKDHEREQERERARDRAKYIISVSRRTRSLQPTTTTSSTTTSTTGSRANLNCSLIVSDGREGEELDCVFEKDGEGKEVEVDVESHVEWKPFRTIVFGSYDACSGVDGKCDSKGPIKRRCEDDENGHENEIENEDRRGGGERIFSSERNGTGLADSDTDADSGRTLFEPTPSLTASAFPNSTPCLPTSTSSLANQGSNVHSDSSASEDRRSRPDSKVNSTSGDKTNSASLQPATSLPFHHTHFSAEMVIRLVCGITDNSPLATCSHVFFTNT